MLRINGSQEGTNAEGTLPDTYIDVRGWGKGLLWVNGVNLGWFWPSAGPQARTLSCGGHLPWCAEHSACVVSRTSGTLCKQHAQVRRVVSN